MPYEGDPVTLTPAHVNEELGKIDTLERAVRPVASLGAIDIALACEDRRAQLLGLDKPSAAEVTVAEL